MPTSKPERERVKGETEDSAHLLALAIELICLNRERDSETEKERQQERAKSAKSIYNFSLNHKQPRVLSPANQ